MKDFRWEVVAPREWPEAPEEMSFTALRQIEACPLRYGLERGKYLGLEAGYPRPTPWGAIAGTVIHGAMEKFAEALRAAPCGAGEGAVYETLKALGGISQVLMRTIEEALRGLERNPRSTAHISALRQQLTRELPKFRVEVQRRIGGLQLPPGRAPRSGGGVEVAAAAGDGLPDGAYPEVTVHAPPLGWKGTFDLLVVAPETTLYEFKTGDRKPEHEEQVRIYALLWWRSKQNIRGALPTRIRLIYPDGAVEVPALSPEGALSLERELLARTAAAKAAVGRAPPSAKPAVEICRWCGVKHLCDEYWAASGAGVVVEGAFVDLEVAMGGANGQGVFSVAVKRGPAPVAGKHGTLVAARHSSYQAGRTYRLVGAQWTVQDEDPSALLITLGPRAEAFLVP